MMNKEKVEKRVYCKECKGKAKEVLIIDEIRLCKEHLIDLVVEL